MSKETIITEDDLKAMTPEQLDLLQDKLIVEIRDIQLQLSNPNKTIDGRRMSSREWHTWAFAAKSAVKHKQDTLQMIKNLKRQPLQPVTITPKRRDKVIAGAFALLVRDVASGNVRGFDTEKDCADHYLDLAGKGE